MTNNKVNVYENIKIGKLYKFKSERGFTAHYLILNLYNGFADLALLFSDDPQHVPVIGKIYTKYSIEFNIQFWYCSEYCSEFQK